MRMRTYFSKNKIFISKIIVKMLKNKGNLNLCYATLSFPFDKPNTFKVKIRFSTKDDVRKFEDSTETYDKDMLYNFEMTKQGCNALARELVKDFVNKNAGSFI